MAKVGEEAQRGQCQQGMLDQSFPPAHPWWEEVESTVTVLVWTDGIRGKSKAVERVRIQLEPDGGLVRQKKYLLKSEARRGLEE